MANNNRKDAEAVFLNRLRDLGLLGRSFYASEVEKQGQAIVEQAGLNSKQYYMLAALVEDVAFRCLGIDGNQPWCQAAHEATSKLSQLDAHCLAYHRPHGSQSQPEANNAQTTALPPGVDELIANDRPD